MFYSLVTLNDVYISHNAYKNVFLDEKRKARIELEACARELNLSALCKICVLDMVLDEDRYKKFSVPPHALITSDDIRYFKMKLLIVFVHSERKKHDIEKQLRKIKKHHKKGADKYSNYEKCFNEIKKLLEKFFGVLDDKIFIKKDAEESEEEENLGKEEKHSKAVVDFYHSLLDIHYAEYIETYEDDAENLYKKLCQLDMSGNSLARMLNKNSVLDGLVMLEVDYAEAFEYVLKMVDEEEKFINGALLEEVFNRTKCLRDYNKQKELQKILFKQENENENEVCSNVLINGDCKDVLDNGLMLTPMAKVDNENDLERDEMYSHFKISMYVSRNWMRIEALYIVRTCKNLSLEYMNLMGFGAIRKPAYKPIQSNYNTIFAASDDESIGEESNSEESINEEKNVLSKNDDENDKSNGVLINDEKKLKEALCCPIYDILKNKESKSVDYADNIYLLQLDQPNTFAVKCDLYAPDLENIRKLSQAANNVTDNLVDEVVLLHSRFIQNAVSKALGVEVFNVETCGSCISVGQWKSMNINGSARKIFFNIRKMETNEEIPSYNSDNKQKRKQLREKFIYLATEKYDNNQTLDFYDFDQTEEFRPFDLNQFSDDDNDYTFNIDIDHLNHIKESLEFEPPFSSF